jgi:hypothetical protein
MCEQLISLMKLNMKVRNVKKLNYQDYKMENFTISNIYKLGKPFANNLL